MKLMVIDGNSILNRAFYGIRLLSTASGLYTNAVYGFLNILQRLLSEDKPDALCVTFDLKAPTFRHRMYDGYKASRKGMPDELAMQVPYIKSVLDAMNIPRYELEGYEADDLIGTISRRCADAGWDCIAVTGDRDSLQLITDSTHVKLVTSKAGKNEYLEYDPAVFEEKYGFEPIHLIDLKALMGDSSDCIPGVAGVGEKTATELICKYRSLENVFAAIGSGELKPAVEKKLSAGRESAEMSYTLAKIITDAPLAFNVDDNRIRPYNNDDLYKLFTELEFTKLIEKFGLTAPGIRAAADRTLDCSAVRLYTQEDVAKAASAFVGSPVYIVCSPALADVTFGAGESFFTVSNASGSTLAPIFTLENKIGHDIKDIQLELLKNDLPTDGWIFDTALAAYLLDPSASDYAIEELAAHYCGVELSHTPQNEQLSLLDEPDGSGDADKAAALQLLYPLLSDKLRELDMEKLYYDIELPLCPVLAEMEHIGCLVDREALIEYGKLLAANISVFENDIYELAGERFNINSSKQLGTILFDKLGLPPVSKTKSGYSTNIEVLEKLAGKHPIVEDIINYRQLSKLKSTYADGLIKEIREDGRIHTKFNMTVTATGRLSSTEPNLQNIPVRTQLGEEFRKMFIAPPGCLLVDADYSQIELRLLAHISGDSTMLDYFANGMDIHRATAAQVFGVAPEEVTSVQRSRAKAVNFGIVYGISDFSLAQDIKVTRSEAKQYIESYLNTFSGVKRYMSDIVAQAKADGYVSTIFGRRRYLPELSSKNFNLRSFAERVALNMPIQGTAADIIKLAMINVSRRFRNEGMDSRLILQIHDELIAQCPEAEAEKARAILTEEMENVVQLSVRLLAEAKIGASWYDAK
ncbi:MAG: DNA polymerase I [Clostridiales bacterium]|nr:DNA polymerase I [Clostridiales bacterium]